SCMLLHVRVRTARLYGDDDRRLRAARRSLHRGSRCTDAPCTVTAMKTLIAASLGVWIALPLTAQTPTTAQQLIAARDTVWRAWFANDTVLLRRFIPQSAAAAERGETLKWSDRSAIFAGARQIARSARSSSNSISSAPRSTRAAT